MTEDRLPLADLLAKAGDGDFLRSVAEAVVQLLMETDVEGVIGAGRHERSGERITYRNGYRERTLDTRLGSLQLRIPKLRQGSYFPPFLEPRKTSEKALVAVIQEAWVGGVSTRRVDDLVQAMGLSGISKSTVSKLCKDIDDRVNAFLDRPLTGDWPYLWLDATYLKQREGGRIVSVAAIIAVAANTDGKREIVGLHIGPNEAETFWATFLKSLVRRGLRGVKLVISDAHEGLKAAIRRVMGASWQRCRVHWMRNAQAYVGRAQQSMVSAALRQAFIQPDRASASQTLRHTADQLRGKWPKLSAFIDESETDVLAHMDFPTQHRSKIHSTNPIERVNKEVKRRADVVGIFRTRHPSSASSAPCCSNSMTSGSSSTDTCRPSPWPNLHRRWSRRSHPRSPPQPNDPRPPQPEHKFHHVDGRDPFVGYAGGSERATRAAVRFLFVHHNFPGQYLHLLRELVRDPRHEVTFLSNANGSRLEGVRRVDYRALQGSAPGIYPDAREFEAGMIRAASVASVAKQLAKIGYRPDIMLGHNGWGEVLNLKDVWPDVPLIPYFEFFYHDRGLDVDFDPEFPITEGQRATIRARNAVNFLGLSVADVGQTPTRFQQETYPEWTRSRIRILPEGVDLAVCRPRADASFELRDRGRRWTRRSRRPLITYVARNLEPYRGFHVLMRALPTVLRARPDADVVIVGGDSVSYGPALPNGESWRHRLLLELGKTLPTEQVFFAGTLPYKDYLSLLQTSAAHIYLTYPFVASWSLREAMACGCAIIASDTGPVREFIEHQNTGLLVPFHSPGGLAKCILDLLEEDSTQSKMRRAARGFAVRELSLKAQLNSFLDMTSEYS